MTNRLKDIEEEEPELPLGDQTIIPLMCMASVEPVKIKNFILSDYVDLKQLNQKSDLLNATFSLNFSSFKKNEDSPSYLNFVISCLTAPMMPELLSAIFASCDTKEAKNFLMRPLSKFNSFKKAILLFDARPYSLKEFETVVMDWRKSLE